MPAAKGKKIYKPVTHCIFDNDGTLLGKLVEQDKIFYIVYYTILHPFRYGEAVQRCHKQHTQGVQQEIHLRPGDAVPGTAHKDGLRTVNR